MPMFYSIAEKEKIKLMNKNYSKNLLLKLIILYMNKIMNKIGLIK